MSLFDRFRKSDETEAETTEKGGIGAMSDDQMRDIAFQSEWRCSYCKTPQWQTDLFLSISDDSAIVACESCCQSPAEKRHAMPDPKTGHLGYRIPAITDRETLRHRHRDDVVTSITDATGDVWMGEHPRQMIESRHNNDPEKLWLGYHQKGNRIRDLGMDYDDLFTHVFCQGTTGGGKSTWALFAAMQLIWDGSGGCLIDPHGDLVDDVLERMPPHRRDDVVVFDPSDTQSERHVPLNLLDVEAEPGDQDYHERVSSAVADVRSGMRRGGDWGQRMGPINDNLARAMIMHEDDMTFLDYRDILLDESRRAEFAREMDANPHFFASDYTAKIAGMGDIELSPLVRRLEEWTSSKIVRDMISEPRSEISFEEIIKEDKILLCSVNLPDPAVQRMVSSAIIRRLWRVAKSQPKGQRSPFITICDEFDDVLNPEMNIDDILSNARKFRFGLIIMTQYLKKLDDKQTERAVKKLCNTKITFRDPEGDIEGKADSQAATLANYKALVKFRIDGQMKGPYKMHGFPPYPPRRSDREADEWIRQPALRQYGVPREGVQSSKQTTDRKQALLKAIYDSELISGDEEGVRLEDARERIVDRLDIEHPAEIDDLIAEIPSGDDGDLERSADDDGSVQLHVTPRGRTSIWQTGSNIQSGGVKHSQLLMDCYAPLSQLGAEVQIPAGDHKGPDATIKPDTQARPHHILPRLTDGAHAVLEAESATGKTKPGKTCMNVQQALQNDQRCILLCRPDDAQGIWNTIHDPPSRSPQTLNGQHRLYNIRDHTIDGQIMLRPADATETVWIEEPDGPGFVLMDSNGNEFHRFGSEKAVREDIGSYPHALPTDDDVPEQWTPVKIPFMGADALDHDQIDIVIVPGDATDPDDLQAFVNGENVPITQLPKWEEQQEEAEKDEIISDLRDKLD